MRKWRPTFKAIYVIPEIRGNMDSLEVILNRILPLRIFKNQDDCLIFLGDYVDGDANSDKVIDSLINIKEEYKDRIIFLRGNHEEMLLDAINSEKSFNYWTDNGGYSTIEAYAKRAAINSTPYAIKSNRLLDIIPKSHIEFIKQTEYFHILNDYCFFHGGFNPAKTIAENNVENFAHDFTSSKYLKDCIKNNKEPIFKDNYIFIGNHNYLGDKPFIHNKYFQLGGMAPRKLVVFELNSMTACAATRTKSRIYKYNFNVYES